ncbi:MAG TPA: extracellular solute-binding protein, partial [Trueperaceae bacterium]|nr:extracellular solute-binding protein [Trueperaceae bacterium]
GSTTAFAAQCNGTQVTLNFANWAAAETATANELNQAINAFEAQNPCIKINSIAIPYNNVLSQLTIMAVGNNTPDVMELSSGMPQALAAQGALADLSKYTDPKFISDNFPKMLSDGQYQGKQVALPLSLTPHGFWYNKKLMAQAGISSPPKTIDQLDKDMAIIKQKLPSDIYPFGIMDDKALYTVVVMWPWLDAYCNQVPMADNALGWTQKCSEQAFNWFQMLGKKGYTPIGNDIKDNRQLFATGKMVFKVDGPYMRGIVSSIDPQYKDNAAFANTFGATTIPVGPTGTSHTAIDIHLIAMGATTQHPQDAWKFINFMIGSQASVKDFLIPEGGLPPLKSSQQQFASQLQQPYQQEWVNAIIPSAEPVPYNPAWNEASNYIINALQATLNGSNVSQTLGLLNAQLKRIYPNYLP